MGGRKKEGGCWRGEVKNESLLLTIPQNRSSESSPQHLPPSTLTEFEEGAGCKVDSYRLIMMVDILT